MISRLLILIAFFVSCVLAAEKFGRPNPCPVNTTYKKDCNICTCAANGKDVCGKVDCSRQKQSFTTSKPNTKRPGDCPTVVTPAPGSNTCKKRNEKSTCTEDKNCPQAKKCCPNGCNVFSCRNAIYRYNKGK